MVSTTASVGFKEDSFVHGLAEGYIYMCVYVVGDLPPVPLRGSRSWLSRTDGNESEACQGREMADASAREAREVKWGSFMLVFRGVMVFG
jgi:hypothetical protein